MQIEYLFFLVFIIAAFWFIPRLPIARRSGLSTTEINILLCLKISIAVFCTYYFNNILSYSDYKAYNIQGFQQYQLLLSDPYLFFTDAQEYLEKYGFGGFWKSSDSFWAYSRFIVMYKLIAFTDLITKGNFYFNSTIFSSFVFIAHITFYRIYSDMYPGNKFKIVIVTFLLPSVLMYTACVHKDGLLFICLSAISYFTYFFFKPSHIINWKLYAWLFFGLTGVFIFRNYVLLAILPALTVAMLIKFLPLNKWLILVSCLVIFGSLFFITGYFHTSFSLPAAVLNRRQDFEGIEAGNTGLIMRTMYPNLKSFIINFPQALNHSLLRPYLLEFPGVGILLAALELFLYQLLFLLFVFLRNKKQVFLNEFNTFGLLTFLITIIIIGYTVPNAGAIVRYRSVFWVFVLCPMVCCTNWSRMMFNHKRSNSLVQNL